jgi:hypothetical protein
MANPEGQCFAFDSRGAGYGRGEGIGTVILKRLSHAIQDGDPIHSVILNSGINQDGKTAGILLPNSNAQAALVKQVYESAGLNPAHTLYVEAHGTVSYLPPLHLSKTPQLISTRGLKQVFLSFFLLIHHLGWTLIETPVNYRRQGRD